MSILTTEAMIVAGAIGAMAFSAIGSGMGCGLACNTAVGSWKKSYMQNKSANFQLTVFGGMPLTQTFYGFVLQFFIAKKLVAISTMTTAAAFGIMMIGLLAGAAIGFGAYSQGRVAASAADALSETGKGFANYLIASGIVETVTVFAMAFGILLLNQLA